MPKPYSQDVTNKITQLLFCKWKPAEVATELGVSLKVVQRVQKSLREHGLAKPPDPPGGRPPRGRPRLINDDTSACLIEFVRRNPWVYQAQMKEFLEEEYGKEVSKSAVSRLLTKKGSVREKGKWGKRRFDIDEESRQDWRDLMQSLQPDQLVFVGEAAFSDRNGWRRMARAPIGSTERYQEPDLAKGNKTWVVLAAYTSGGYLPCSQARGGIFNKEVFQTFLQTQLLPHCFPYSEDSPQPRSVIVFDGNCGDVDEDVRQTIENHGCKLLLTPPYSPDLDPLELTFGVLATWVQRHVAGVFSNFDGDFGQFLCLAIRQSCCDAFAKAHFEWTPDGYLFNGDIDDFHAQLTTGAFEQDNSREHAEAGEDAESNARETADQDGHVIQQTLEPALAAME